MIELDFDPLLRIGGLTLRWQTIATTLALLLAFTLAALTAPGTGSRRSVPRRLDDLILIVAGIVPGAVVGGRLVHGVVHFDRYAADPYGLLDPSVGSLSLLGAVLGGLLTGAYVAYLIRAPVRRWADTAAAVMLLAIGLGKLAMLLGGSGQGVPFDGPWSVAFTGAGPWVSASPELPSHPAQAYEGIWLLAWVPVLLALRRQSALGASFVVALTWFLLGRVLIGFMWRDPEVIGPFNAEQVLALLALAGTLVFAPRVIVNRTPRRRSRALQEQNQ